MTSLILTTYNRPDYLQRCLDSLISLSELPDELIIVDDCSTDERVTDITSSFIQAYSGKVKWYALSSNRGIKKALKYGIESALSAELIINLDPDAVVKPEFITRLKELKSKFPDRIISGFNSLNKTRDGLLRNPIKKQDNGEGYAIKQTINGINMCFDRGQYEHRIKPALSSWGNWDQAVKDTSGFVHSVPSLVQHIGLHSSMGHDDEIPDYAHDFKTVQLPDITLFGIDAHDPKGLLRAAEISQIDVQFGGVNIITQRLFSGREAYSEWIVKHLHEQFDTSHVLIIHPDGYILNPQVWDDEWMQYDYIGAAWEWYDNNQVGNGGFCLRSKRFCELTAKLAEDGIITEFHPEDDVLCRKYRKHFDGMKFAPVEIARKFSIEAWKNPNKKVTDQFGFHGRGLGMSALPKWQRLVSGRQTFSAVEEYLRKKNERPSKRRW